MSSNPSVIVVGVDFSEPSRHALGEAIRLSRTENSKLIIVHFIYDEELMNITRWKGIDPKDLIAGRKTHLSRWISECEGEDVNPEVVVEIGHPFSEMMQLLHKENAQLLILGASGEAHQDQKNIVGHLALSCLRRGPCEVMLIRENHTGPFRNIVAAIDFSDNSKRAVSEAAVIARTESCPLHVLHIFAPVWRHYAIQNEPREEIDAYLDEVRSKFADFVSEELADVAGLEVTFEIRESLTASDGIIQFVKDVDADLVVIGLIGQSPSELQLPGTTAERVVQGASGSVLAVRPAADFGWQPTN